MKSIYIRCDEKTLSLAKKLAQKNDRSMNKQLVHMINSCAKDQDISIKSFEEEDNNLSKKVIKMKIHPHGLESWDANGMPVDEDQTNTSGLKGLVGISKLDLDHTNNE
tara:strand:- start:267 stop:590 length:324 start_codon:yes stop_codon:yes gene_type:complete